MDLRSSQYEKNHAWYYKLSQLPMTDATVEHRGEPTTAASLNQYNFNSILNMCSYTHRYVYFPPLVKEAFLLQIENIIKFHS